MVDVIHLHDPDEAATGPQRLNLFAGRYLGEREFDLRQAYADARLEGLLTNRQPGIVQGLEVRLDSDGSALRIQPGTGIAADGQALRLFFPLDTTWQDVVTTHKARLKLAANLRLNGYYFLTLRRTVYLEEDTSGQQPCTRTELNPLRDSTVETAAYVDLQAITGLPDMSGTDQARAANRICVFHLDHSPFVAGDAALPLALVRVANNKLVWLDMLAGRYEAQPQAAYRTLLAHYQDVVARLTADQASGARKQLGPNAALKAHLGVDYLPSAGPLPDYLVTDIAGKPKPKAKQREDWVAPHLRFKPNDLQLELVPIPLSDVLPTLRREMARPPVDLIHALEDRIRIMAAIPDQDFRPDLLDLPDVDSALQAQLSERGQNANDDYLYWRYFYDLLYQDLENHVDAAQLRAVGLQLDDAGQPVVEPPPRTPAAFYHDMIAERRHRLPKGAKQLPPPFAWGVPAGVPLKFDKPADPDYAAFDGTALYVLEDELSRKIQSLEEELDANDHLLGVFDTFLSLQRQQVDTISVSLSNLAGGIPGDGSGQKFIRWTPFTNLEHILPADPTPQDGGGK